MPKKSLKCLDLTTNTHAATQKANYDIFAAKFQNVSCKTFHRKKHQLNVVNLSTILCLSGTPSGIRDARAGTNLRGIWELRAGTLIAELGTQDPIPLFSVVLKICNTECGTSTLTPKFRNTFQRWKLQPRALIRT